MAEGGAVRRATIDGLPAIVLDGLMPAAEAARLFQWLSSQPFARTEFAREDTRAFLHWVCKMSIEDCARLPLYETTMRMVEAHFPERARQRCYRAYCNSASYGDMLFTHTDSQPGVEGLTALWFIAPRWELEWGGETILFDSTGDAEFVVSPWPGRLLLFDGRIRHAGRPPSRVCVIPRLTFALKLEAATRERT